MASEPWGLLVVPSDALRGMLEGGACGARPPTVYRELHRVEAPTAEEVNLPGFDGWDDHWLPNYGTMEIDLGCDALALRWEGQDLPHGWLAAGLAMGACQMWTLGGRIPWGNGAAVIEVLQREGCTIITIDDQGREVGEAHHE